VFQLLRKLRDSRALRHDRLDPPSCAHRSQQKKPLVLQDITARLKLARSGGLLVTFLSWRQHHLFRKIVAPRQLMRQ